jgi:hypothetical protein
MNDKVKKKILNVFSELMVHKSILNMDFCMPVSVTLHNKKFFCSGLSLYWSQN